MCVHARFVTNMQKYMQVHRQKKHIHANESKTDIHKPDMSKQRCVCVCVCPMKCCNGEVLFRCHKTDSFTKPRRKRLAEELLKTS